MADGQPLRIGRNNTSDAETRLRRSGTDRHTALIVDNSNGNGIVGQGVGGRTGVGVVGRSQDGFGVSGDGGSGGVFGTSRSGDVPGVWGQSREGTGVRGSGSTAGVSGTSSSGPGVFGQSRDGTGVQGTGPLAGVSGTSNDDTGVYGAGALGVFGEGTVDPLGFGVAGHGPNIGVWGLATGTDGDGVVGDALGTGFAGDFSGPVFIDGNLLLTGRVIRGSRTLMSIDHPLDPANKYLNYSSVGSPEMKNVHDGVAVLDEQGAAWIELPEWFAQVNGDLRYQLTAVGLPMPELHVAEELSDNHFMVAGGEPGAKICWQVTGVQQDRWAEANRLRVEEEKSAEEQGHYLHPELYGEPEESGIGRARRQERLRQMETMVQRRGRLSTAESPPAESTERAYRGEQEPED